MRVSSAAVFSVTVAAVAACAVITALAWPPKAALFPLTMGIPLLVLALVQALIELRHPPRVEDTMLARRRTLAVFAWMGVFIALVLLLGFPVAVPLFVFAYLAFESGERWGLSVVLAAAAWAFFHVLFERVLHFPFEAGLLFQGGSS